MTKTFYISETEEVICDPFARPQMVQLNQLICVGGAVQTSFPWIVLQTSGTDEVGTLWPS